MVRTTTALALAAQPFGAAALMSLSKTEVDSTANPIRRVVTLLQSMQAKVTAQGKKEEELYEKFMCYCKTGSGDLTTSISAAEAKITQDTSSLEAADALAAQLKQELASHEADRADAKDAVAKANALRAKEAGIFAKDSSDFKTNIAALGKAIDALEKGAGGSFLQTSNAAVLKNLVINMDLSTADRDMLSNFLQGSQGYAPASGEITGILKQMKDTMEKDLADITATEEAAIKDFNELIAAKEKEIAANTQAIETKTDRAGRTGLEIVDLKEALDDTTKALYEDNKFLANLGTSCKTKTAEWEERSKTRAGELLALAETIKIINDDDALELFKKTLPSPSLMQTVSSNAVVRGRALTLLKAAQGHKDPRMDMIMLALTGRSHGTFDKVLKMIEDMVALLGKEQTDDDSKKAYCEAELDKSEDKHKDLEQALSDLEKAKADAEENIANLKEELAALASGIKALDKSVAEGTAQRKAENAEFKSTMAADTAAKELIKLAQNRLAKFYNPALYTAPAKVELGSEQRIAVSMGSEEQPTVAPSGIAGTGITAFVQTSSEVAPPPPPDTWDSYQKKGQEHSGVTEMMNLLITDLEKEMTEMQTDEKNAQAEYETFMADSRDKRAADSKAIADKEGVKAELEGQVQKNVADHKATLYEAMATAETIKDLHLECDWLVSNFAARKEARVGEVDSLKKAKAVLSGSDYSL